jgi:hypothetical protein
MFHVCWIAAGASSSSSSFFLMNWLKIIGVPELCTFVELIPVQWTQCFFFHKKKLKIIFRLVHLQFLLIKTKQSPWTWNATVSSNWVGNLGFMLRLILVRNPSSRSYLFISLTRSLNSLLGFSLSGWWDSECCTAKCWLWEISKGSMAK